MVRGSDGVYRVVEPDRIEVTAKAPPDFWSLVVAGGLLLVLVLLRRSR